MWITLIGLSTILTLSMVNVKSIDIILALLHILVNQGSAHYDTIRNKNTFTAVIMYFWIFTSAIMSMAFTSLLLQTFMYKKSSLTVDSLAELLSNTDLMIAYPEMSLLEPSFVDVIGDRNEEFVRKYPKEANDLGFFVQSQRLAKEVEQRRAVIVCPTLCTQLLKNMNPNIRIMESQNKYNHRYIHTYFTRDIEEHKTLNRMLTSLFESGMLARNLEISASVADIYSKTEPSYTGPKDMNQTEQIRLGPTLRGSLAIVLIGCLFSKVTFIVECLPILLNLITRVVDALCVRLQALSNFYNSMLESVSHRR